jgi:hypothetical protein
MRRQNFTAFDENLPSGTIHTSPAFTSNGQDSRLAQYDQLAVQVVIDNVAGANLGGFDLYLEHSADDRNFIPANPAISQPSVGSGEVSFKVLQAGSTNVAWGTHNGSTPLLGYVRFRMFFSNSTTSAHVRVLVTQRDSGA